MLKIILLCCFSTALLCASEVSDAAKRILHNHGNADFVACLDFFIRHDIDPEESVYFKKLIDDNIDAYNTYMKRHNKEHNGNRKHN
jgi:hypothetical protein